MRAGPLSQSKVIEILNSYFVPVYAVNEDYRKEGTKPKDEKAEYSRIYREALGKKMSAGSVHVYLVHPGGEVFDSIHVADAAKESVLEKRLQAAVEKLGLKAGKAVIPPKPQVPAPDCAEGSLKLHLVARSLDGRGVWTGIPGENWIVLSPSEVRELLPGHAKVGDQWSVPGGIAKKLFTHFYAGTENNDPDKNHFQRAELSGRIVSLDERSGRARLQGSFVMDHSFYHKADGKTVEASVVGYVEFSATDRSVQSLNLVTDHATYNGGEFGVAVRSR